MPAISYLDFSGGLDRRLPPNVQTADKLYILRNAYITTGKKIKKRPGLRKLTGNLNNNGDGSATKGLEASNGRLTVFVASAPATPNPPVINSPPDLVDLQVISQVNNTPGVDGELVDIVYAELFQGFLFVVAQFFDPATNASYYTHNYLNGVTTNITDVNCPQTASVTKAASRIFAVDGDVVRYCAAGDATDWTTSGDAGFLPVGLQQDTKGECTAVGTFEDALVVFFGDSMQIWDVAVDPSANQIRKRISGVGIDKSPISQASFSRDLAFLSPFGVRSAVASQQTDRIDDNDLGTPVDELILPDIQSAGDPSTGDRHIFGTWIHQLGQYWVLFDQGSTSKAWVYSFSKQSKLSCWSEYTFPIPITGITTLAGKVYVRDDTYLYEFVLDQYTDDGEAIEVEVQMAFQDAKTPGVDKMFYGADFALQGSWSLSYLFDSRDMGQETTPYELSGDTRPGDKIPVEVTSPSIAPVFRHSANESAEIDGITLYYELLRT